MAVTQSGQNGPFVRSHAVNKPEPGLAQIQYLVPILVVFPAKDHQLNRKNVESLNVLVRLKEMFTLSDKNLSEKIDENSTW